MSWTTPLPGGLPAGHKEHTESHTTILLPDDRTAFLNPPQQFNRDLSVAVIRAWNERRREDAEARWRERGSKNKRGRNKGKKVDVKAEERESKVEEQPAAGPSTERKFKPANFKIIEALSATGLRSIRYAKEIPDVKFVLANDLSPTACEAMRMNVAYNGVGENTEQSIEGAQGAANGQTTLPTAETAQPDAGSSTAQPATANESEELLNGRRPGCRGKVRVNEGDACSLMYAHRDPRDRVHVVDLDPYGTAAPFIDAAISCIADGGLLCVTCTDVAVLAGAQYPEKAFANYGGASVNAEYCHEVGLRLVLNSLAQAAARYGRYITPLLSFSIDFYVRVFVTVSTGPLQVKDLSTNTGLAHVCAYCQSWELQPFGRVMEREGNKGGINRVHKSAQTTSSGTNCQICGGRTHIGGPMWLGPIQDHAFAERALKSIEGQQADYATWARMHGMLTMAKEELDDPFYFTCNRIGGFFKATSCPSNKAVNALLNAGYNISRSHASPGSVKTDAPRSFIFDIFREFIKSNPVRIDNIPEGNPARELLAKPMIHEVDFTPNPNYSKFEKGEKIVYYQENPLPNWGPAARAKTSKPVTGKSVAGAIKAEKPDETKRKADAPGEEREAKMPKVDTVDEEDQFNA